MTHRALAPTPNDCRQSSWQFFTALFFTVMFSGQLARAGESAPSNYPNALGLGTNPLMVWTDEYLRTWAYRNEAEVLDPQTQVQVRAPGFYKQYYSPAGYATYLRATKSGQPLVATHGNFTPVSGQHQKVGSAISSTVTADAGGIEIIHTLTYVDGEQVVAHQWQITNLSGITYTDVALRYGGDTFFAGYDSARGYFDADTKFLYCANPDQGATGLMGMQAGFGYDFDGYVEGEYYEVATTLLASTAVAPFPNTINYLKEGQSDFDDNGMAVEWRRPTLAPNGSFTVVLYEKWTDAGGIQVLVPPATSTEPGTQSTITFRVQNLQSSTQVLNLRVNGPEGWIDVQPSPITLAVGEVRDIPVDITIPGATTPGIYPIELQISYDGGETYPQTGEYLLTVLAPTEPPPPVVNTLPSGSDLPLSSGERTIYTAISPSTPQGVTSVLAALSGRSSTVTRAFAWDNQSQGYIDLTNSETPTDGINPWTGIFIATRTRLNYSLNGYSTATTFTDLTLRHDGWTFAGIPPLEVSTGNVITKFIWPIGDYSVASDEVALEIQSPSLGQALITLDVAMGNGGGDLDSTRPYYWNGTDYEQVNRLEAGKGYWFKNNMTGEDITLQVSNQAQALRVAAVGARTAGAQAPTVRYRGSPPPPPSSSAGKTASSSSSSGGCGVGSGIASLAFLMLMFGFRFLVVRR